MATETKRVYCINCGEKVSYRVKTTRENVIVIAHDIMFSYLEETAYCSICGGEIYVPEINDANVQARNEAYRKASFYI